VSLVYSHTVDVAAQSPPSAPAVESAKKREQAVRTVAVEFRLTEDVAAGGVTKSTPPFDGKKGRVIPAKATRLSSTNRLVIAGTSTRYENNHPAWATGSDKTYEIRLVNTMNSSSGKSLFSTGLTSPSQPEGYIAANVQSDDIKSTYIVPLTTWYRGTQRSISPYVLSNYYPSGSTIKIGGNECREYAQSGDRANGTFLWFDTKSGDLLRRIRTDKQRKPQVQYDVEYRLDDSGVWTPVSWVRNEFSAEGEVCSSTRAEVLSTRLNADYPETDFDVTFPPGTRVYSARENKTYLVQDDGTMREFSLATGEAGGERVDQAEKPLGGRYVGWIAALLIGVCVLLAYAFLRRRRAYAR
jgi:hypothetical protein